MYCSWEMLGRPSTITCTTTLLGKGPCLPQGSWCGVFCVSGPHVCQPKALGWSTSWRIFGCNWPLSHSWLDYPQLYCCAKSLFSPPFFVFSSPSFPRVDPYIVYVLFPQPIHLPPSCSPLPLFGFCPFTPVTLPALLFLGFPLRVTARFSTLSFHPLMYCLFLGGLTCLGLFFLKPLRAPPASRPRTATNTTVDANCSATNVCRPPPATAATTKRVCKRCKPPKDNPVAGSGSSSPPTPSVTAPRSASPGKRSGDACKVNPARATPRRK